MEDINTTVAGIAVALGCDSSALKHSDLPRFAQPGWEHDGAAPASVACPDCNSSLELLGKPYESRGRRYRYVALVCLACSRVFVLPDLGLSGRAGMTLNRPANRHPTDTRGGLDEIGVSVGRTDWAEGDDHPILPPGSPLAASTYPLTDLPLPARLKVRIKVLDVETVGDLSTVTRAQLLAIRHLGRNSLERLLKVLDAAAIDGLPAVRPDSTGTVVGIESQAPANGQVSPRPPQDLVAVVDAIEDLFSQLPPRSADLLRRRWCLDGTEPITLQDLGLEYGLSRERIRQVQVQAISKVTGRLRRHPFSAAIATLMASAADEAAGTDTTSVGWRDVAGQMWPGCSAGEVGGFLYGIVHRGLPDLKTQWAQLESAHRAQLKSHAAQARREFTQARSQQSRERRLDRLLEGVWWPTASVRMHVGDLMLRPVRDVTPREDGQPLLWPSRKLDRDVQCESGLEAGFFELCDAAGKVETFTEQPAVIWYEFSGTQRRYFPDALLRLTDGRHVLVEIKPVPHMADAINLAKWDAAWRWCSERGVGFLVCSDRHSAAEVFDRTIPAALERMTLETLEKAGFVDWPTYGGYQSITNTTAFELVALADRLQLETHHRPWRLQVRSKRWGPERRARNVPIT